MSCDCGCGEACNVRRSALSLRKREGDVGEDDQF
jgi:hypothetical protein